MGAIYHKIKGIFSNRKLTAIVGMLIGTLIYCFSIEFILEFGGFYAGGVTGVSQILATIFNNPALKSLFIGLFNIPLFILGWKSVSKRFAILSLLSVGLQMLVLLLFDWIHIDLGFNPFASIQENTLVLAVLGGFLTGVGCGICLRAGASTGGMDIVSQRASLKLGIPFVAISGTVDIIIIVAGAIIGKDIAVAVYTIIRLGANIITLDKIHTIYKYQKINIVTNRKDELKAELLANFNHGMTIFQAVGGYSNEQKWVIEAIVLTYEVEDYKRLIYKIDPTAFISYYAVKGVTGFYNKNVIS